MVSEYTVPRVATESKHARALALAWMNSRREEVASSGWNRHGRGLPASGRIAVEVSYCPGDEVMKVHGVEGASRQLDLTKFCDVRRWR